MKAYQIQVVDKDKCGHFLYFQCSGKPYDKAAITMNEYLAKQTIRWFGNRELFKTIGVGEYDKPSQDFKKGGLKFKLKLTFTEIGYVGGRRERNYYYYAVIPTKIK